MIAAGVLSGLDGKAGLAGWRWLYVIEGGGTMVAGILAYWLLPDFPQSGQTKWLTEQERRFAEWRLARAANDEVDDNGGIKAGIKAALTDPKTWALVLTQVCLLSSQTWTYFFPVSLLFESRMLLTVADTSLDDRQDARIQQHHHAANHGASLRLRLLHLTRQLSDSSQNRQASVPDHVASSNRHCWQHHGHIVYIDRGALHGHVPDVRWFLLGLQCCPGLDREHYPSDPHQARRRLRTRQYDGEFGQHLWLIFLPQQRCSSVPAWWHHSVFVCGRGNRDLGSLGILPSQAQPAS